MYIRKATRDDIPAMLKLIKELAEYEKAPEEVTVDPLHFEESGFGPNPVWWAFVAETPSTPSTPSTVYASSTISAFALYYIRYSTWKGQVMYLEDLIVTEKSRRMGIGKLLIERLIEEAKEKGFKRIVWQVLDWNQPAIDFYKTFDAKFDPEWVNVTLEVQG
jgi:GNAT superfamily N-acetyltransferase